MIINRSFKDFKFRYRKKIKLYTTKKVKDENILNLIDNFLDEKIVYF